MNRVRSVEMDVHDHRRFQDHFGGVVVARLYRVLVLLNRRIGVILIGAKCSDDSEIFVIVVGAGDEEVVSVSVLKVEGN